MLVVLDAGVFVSAAITPGGVASRIVMAGIQRRFEYLLCPMLVDESTAVTRRPKIVRVVSQEDSQRFCDDAMAGNRDVGDLPEIVSHSRDPDDDYPLPSPQSITLIGWSPGDADLLVVTEPPVPVIRLREFSSIPTVDPS